MVAESTQELRSDQEIASSINPLPIAEIVAEKLNIPDNALTTYGKFKAKIDPRELDSSSNEALGKLVLVTGVSPTPAGEGKTTTTVGLADSLNHIGVRSIAALREPSLGPCFGMKGGAHGGGFAQVTPMDDINLHFNGDIHAVTSAHNLLASLIDNHLYWGNQLDIDPESISWTRSLDLNDRVLRSMDLRIRRNLSRTGGFNITAASEIMAILCLAEDLDDLERRLGNIVIGFKRDLQPVRCRDLEIEGALAVLLKDAIHPNLVQTLEHNPVLVHGGPFANIAHGCNSIIATRTAMQLSDVVVTEAGFGADLGAEKFLNIKCRLAGLNPSLIVIVCTVRSLKFQGGVGISDIQEPNVGAVKAGLTNLLRHIENMLAFGVPAVVALNRFSHDSEGEHEAIVSAVKNVGSDCFVCNHWEEGGLGALELAEFVGNLSSEVPDLRFCYDLEDTLFDKISHVATKIYRAQGVEFSETATQKLSHYQDVGYGDLPVCIAKTQYSFSANPEALGAPTDHILPVRDVSLSAGAGFVVALSGSIMTMPGLPRRPSAMDIRLNENHQIVGLF